MTDLRRNTSVLSRLKRSARPVKRDVKALALAMGGERVPRSAKPLAAGVVAVP